VKPRRPCFLGIDGGATKTEAVVADAEGRLLGSGRAGPSSYHNAGVRSAVSNLRKSALAACKAAGCELPKVSGSCIGMASLDSRMDRTAVAQMLKRAGFPAATFLTDDSTVALAGAFGGEPGVVVIAGTGSVARGLGHDGSRVRVGGHGYVLGDPGSAFDIGRRAIAAALDSYEGVGDRTDLLDAVMAGMGASEPAELIGLANRGAASVAKIASLSRAVSSSAGDGDAVAIRLLMEAGAELTSLAASALTLLGRAGEGLGVSPCGGVFDSPLVYSAFKAGIEATIGGESLTQPALGPSLGAVLLAMGERGSRPSASLLSNLADSGAALAARGHR
jgi:N-acetylglucosamine kinase-like BadF-type ATPase